MVFVAGEDPYIHTGLTSAENTALWREEAGETFVFMEHQGSQIQRTKTGCD